MKEIKTLEDALALVPEYWYLTPDDKVRHGDQWYYAPRESWEGIPASFYGVLIRLVGSDGYPVRRPILQSVREAEAYLYLKIKNISNREFARVENYVSLDALIITGKTVYPLLDWVAENRK